MATHASTTTFADILAGRGTPRDRLLLGYNQFLFNERRVLCAEMEHAWGPNAEDWIPANAYDSRIHFPMYPTHFRDVPLPSSRAERILKAAGVTVRGEG